VALELGTPAWTEGLLGKRSAENDLGMEAVGAALLRRLLPGILETTPHAGYYAFYSYLVSKWEQTTDVIERSAFRPFFRRHELAYAIACRLHTHRDGFPGGIQGSRGAGRAIDGDGEAIHLKERSETYIDEPFGGYGLFYQRVLQDLRLTRAAHVGWLTARPSVVTWWPGRLLRGSSSRAITATSSPRTSYRRMSSESSER
jgi:hypothetical protein